MLLNRLFGGLTLEKRTSKRHLRKQRRQSTHGENLEQRCLLTTINVFNAAADQWQDLFQNNPFANGPEAQDALQTAVDMWSTAIVDLKNDGNQLDLTINIGTANENSASSEVSLDADGRPIAATITINRGFDGMGGGYFVDTTPTEHSEFTGVIHNAFVGESTYGGNLVDFQTMILHEVGHVFGFSADRLFDTGMLHPALDSAGNPVFSQGDGTGEQYWVFEGPNVTHLLTSDIDSPSNGAGHFATQNDPNYPLQLPGLETPLEGSLDLMNATGHGGRRYLISNLDLMVLADAYDYEVIDGGAEAISNFYAFVRDNGELFVRGGEDDPNNNQHPGPNSDDDIHVSRDGDDLIVSVDVGNDVPGTGPTDAFISRFPLSKVTQVTIESGDGDDEIVVDAPISNIDGVLTIDIDAGSGVTAPQVDHIVTNNDIALSGKLEITGAGETYVDVHGELDLETLEVNTPGAGIARFHSDITADMVEFASNVEFGTIEAHVGQLRLEAPSDVLLSLTGEGEESVLKGLDLNPVLLVYPGTTAEVTGIRITGGSGVGVHNEGALAIHSSFITNHADGGIFNTGYLVVTDTQIINNKNSGGIVNHPGGMLLVNNSLIAANTDNSGGGGIRNHSDAVILDTVIDGNEAAYGGGVLNESQMLIARSEVVNNKATGGAGGGGIYSADNLIVVLTTVDGNEATSGSAGGLLIQQNAFLNSVTVSRNTATVNGGGILLSEHSPGTTKIINSTVSNNAAHFTSGISIASPVSTEIVNSTIAQNHATLGTAVGIGLLPEFAPSVLVRNTLIARNTNDKGILQADVSGPFTSLGHNLIGDVGLWSTFDGPGDQVGNQTTGLIDPQLGPLQNNGGFTETHAIAITSPAVDAGDNTITPVFDMEFDQRFEGFDRILDADGDGFARIDIGAYEIQPEGNPTPSGPEGKTRDQIFIRGRQLFDHLDRSHSRDRIDLHHHVDRDRHEDKDDERRDNRQHLNRRMNAEREVLRVTTQSADLLDRDTPPERSAHGMSSSATPIPHQLQRLLTRQLRGLIGGVKD